LSWGNYKAVSSPRGALFVGSVQEIFDKILMEHELFGHQRYMAQVDISGLPFAMVREVREPIERLASDVIPAVRRAFA
jgi:hypothetical protein